ncbi:MAG: LamG domain-containing protein [Candidatus Omnitrophota bacterium]
MRRRITRLGMVLVLGLLFQGIVSRLLADEKGLVGYWKFDEGEGTTARDSSGKGNDGTIYGATWTRKGQSGSALFFDGESYVDCGKDKSLDITGEFTIEVWVKISESKEKFEACTLVKKGFYRGGWQTYIQENFLAVSSDGGASGVYYRKFLSGKFYPFYHIVITCEKAETESQLKFYVDGVLGETLPVKSGLKSSESPLVIGAWASAEADYFKGILDEIRIYNRALSGEEVKAHYDALSAL